MQLVRRSQRGLGFLSPDIPLEDYYDFNVFLDSIGAGGDWWYGNDFYSTGYDTYVRSGLLTPDEYDTLFFSDPTNRGYVYDPSTDSYFNPQTGTYLIQTDTSGGGSHWWDFIFQPSGSGSSGSAGPTATGGGMVYGSNLPGYCPGGYYHPLDDPYACVPFPDEPAQRQQAQQRAQQQRQQQAQQTRSFPKQQNQNCPQGYQAVRGKDGKIYCVLVNRNAAGAAAGIPNWLLLALIALGVIVLVRR